MFLLLTTIDERRASFLLLLLFPCPRANELSHFHSAGGFASCASFSGANVFITNAFILIYLMQAAMKIAYELSSPPLMKICLNHEHETLSKFGSRYPVYVSGLLCLVLPNPQLGFVFRAVNNIVYEL